MHEFGFTDAGALALLASIATGTVAFALVVKWAIGHECGNRCCPHRKRQQNDPNDP